MPGTGGGEAGDLLLKVTVAPKPGYERKGMDVYTTVSVPYTTAVFGGETLVHTLYGDVMCKIKEGTQSGSKLSLIHIFSHRLLLLPQKDRPFS